MKIVFVAQRYHPIVGGVETQTRLVVQELARAHEVEVIAVNFEARRLTPRLSILEDSLLVPAYDSYRDGEVPVHALTPSPLDRLRMLPVALRAVPRLRRYAYQPLRMFGYRSYRSVYLPRLRALLRDADVVHSVAGGYLGWAAQEAAKEQSIPFVCTPYVHPGQHGADEASVAFYKRSDALFALLETDRRLLCDLGVPAERIHISGVVPLLPPTADPDGFRERYGLQGKSVVLFVGRIVEYKGAPALIEATRHVWQSLPETHFLFAGPATDEARAYFDGADPRIRYLGLISDQEKADAQATCDVFCMPSIHEILPAVYLEAWSYAKPVVGGKAAGLPELIEGHNAGLTTTQDPEELAEVLITLLQDEEARQRMGRNGEALVRARYTREALVGTMESVYKQLINRHPVEQV